MLSLQASRVLLRTSTSSTSTLLQQARHASKLSSSVQQDEVAGQDAPDMPLARVSFKKKSAWQVNTEQGPTAESVAVSGGPSPDRVA